MNNSVFNANFIEETVFLKKSYKMWGKYVHLNKDLASTIWKRSKACKLIRWNSPEDRWHKVNTDGAMCTMFRNASTGEQSRTNIASGFFISLNILVVPLLLMSNFEEC